MVYLLPNDQPQSHVLVSSLLFEFSSSTEPNPTVGFRTLLIQFHIRNLSIKIWCIS
jgi:hypothetical protein